MNAGSKLQGWALGAALILIAAWLAFLGVLALNTDATELTWTRLFSVLTSLEAVVFAAAGALFGTTVQRQRVEDARQEASDAKKEASEAKDEAATNAQAAANGRALAESIKARGEAAGGGGQDASGRRRRSGEGAGAAGAASEVAELVAMARRLFPDD